MILVRTILLALVAVAGALPAAAQTFPDRFFRDARLKAEFHVQFSVERVTLPSVTPGFCVVSGKVEKVFRGPIKPGQALELDVSCKKPEDQPKPGTTIWFDSDELMAAKYIEGFLNRGPYGYAVAIWQLQAIPAPTDTPTMKP